MPNHGRGTLSSTEVPEPTETYIRRITIHYDTVLKDQYNFIDISYAEHASYSESDLEEKPEFSFYRADEDPPSISVLTNDSSQLAAQKMLFIYRDRYQQEFRRERRLIRARRNSNDHEAEIQAFYELLQKNVTELFTSILSVASGRVQRNRNTGTETLLDYLSAIVDLLPSFVKLVIDISSIIVQNKIDDQQLALFKQRSRYLLRFELMDKINLEFSSVLTMFYTKSISSSNTNDRQTIVANIIKEFFQLLLTTDVPHNEPIGEFYAVAIMQRAEPTITIDRESYCLSTTSTSNPGSVSGTNVPPIETQPTLPKQTNRKKRRLCFK